MSSKTTIDLHSTKVGIHVVNSIFIKWNCTLEDKLAILGLSDTEYNFISGDNSSVSVSDEFNRRISYILNIYECLYVLFDNSKNRYEYLRLNNKSKLFKGISPMEYMTKHGTTSALSDVYLYLDSMRYY